MPMPPPTSAGRELPDAVSKPLPRPERMSSRVPGAISARARVPAPTTRTRSSSSPSRQSATEMGRRRKKPGRAISTNCPGWERSDVSPSSENSTTSGAMARVRRRMKDRSFMDSDGWGAVHPTEFRSFPQCRLPRSGADNPERSRRDGVEYMSLRDCWQRGRMFRFVYPWEGHCPYWAFARPAE